MPGFPDGAAILCVSDGRLRRVCSTARSRDVVRQLPLDAAGNESERQTGQRGHGQAVRHREAGQNTNPSGIHASASRPASAVQSALCVCV